MNLIETEAEFKATCQEAAYYIELSNKQVTTMAQMAVLKCLLLREWTTTNDLAKALKSHRTRVNGICRRLKTQGLIEIELKYERSVSWHKFQVHGLTKLGREIAQTKIPK